MIVEVIGNRLNGFKPCQVLEERIARLRHQHGIAWIAQQLEQPAVGLARARRQHDLLRIDLSTTAGVVGRNRFARSTKTERLWSVSPGMPGAERRPAGRQGRRSRPRSDSTR